MISGMTVLNKEQNSEEILTEKTSKLYPSPEVFVPGMHEMLKKPWLETGKGRLYFFK
jgi:hypothetical protein